MEVYARVIQVGTQNFRQQVLVRGYRSLRSVRKNLSDRLESGGRRKSVSKVNKSMSYDDE